MPATVVQGHCDCVIARVRASAPCFRIAAEGPVVTRMGVLNYRSSRDEIERWVGLSVRSGGARYDLVGGEVGGSELARVMLACDGEERAGDVERPCCGMWVPRRAGVSPMKASKPDGGRPRSSLMSLVARS